MTPRGTEYEAGIEAEVQAKGLTAPRVTPKSIDQLIVASTFHVFFATTTVCCLKLKNGFTVIGQSACASPENFNRELGEKIAFDEARDKIWAFEGYALRERLHERDNGAQVKRG